MARSNIINSDEVSKMDFNNRDLDCEGAISIADTITLTTNLCSLNLQNNKIEDRGAIEIARALEHTGIKSLNFNRNKIGYKGAVAIANMLKTTRIESLDLGHNLIGTEGAEALAKGLKRSQVTHLNIEYNQIQNQGIICILDILKKTRITSWNISNNKLTKRGAIAIGDAIKNTKMEYLNVGGNKINGPGVLAIARASKHTKISELDFHRTDMGFEGVLEIGNALKDSQVTSLSLNSSVWEGMVTLRWFKFLFEQLKDTCVTSLDLGNLGITGAKEIIQHDEMRLNIDILMDTLRDSKITSLNLSKNRIRDEGAYTIARALKDTRITDLKLQKTFIKQEGAQALADAIENLEFTCLDLQDNDIGEEGAMAIAKVLIKKPKITSLGFRGNELKNQGAGRILSILNGSGITSIDFSKNKLTNEGGVEIANFLKDAEIITLILGQNNIRELGYRAIAKALENTFVTRFDVDYRKMKDELRVRIQSVLKRNRREVDDIFQKFQNLISVGNDDGLEFIPRDSIELFDYIDCTETILNDKRGGLRKHLIHHEKNIYTANLVKDFIDNIENRLAEFLSKLDYSMVEHVKTLLMCEKYGFNVAVERLLLNRPNYSLIKTGYDVLHPAVYVLMNKYNLPLYIEGMKPTKNDLIEIFNSDVWDNLINQDQLIEFSNDYSKKKLLEILMNQ